MFCYIKKIHLFFIYIFTNKYVYISHYSLSPLLTFCNMLHPVAATTFSLIPHFLHRHANLHRFLYSTKLLVFIYILLNNPHNCLIPSLPSILVFDFHIFAIYWRFKQKVGDCRNAWVIADRPQVLRCRPPLTRLSRRCERSKKKKGRDMNERE